MRRTRRPTSAWGGGVVTAGVVLCALTGCKRAAPLDAKNALSNAGETWCPDGFEAGPNDTCFAIPDAATKETPVLVYLHGMYQGHGEPAEWSAVRVAVDRGFAVVIPRGKRGMCDWRAELKDHYCWPQDPEDTEAMRDLVEEWSRVLWQVDALLEGGTHKRYVLGSSNGGFFASFLATHALFPAHAYAVVNGGALASPGKALTVPLLLIASEASVDQGASPSDASSSDTMRDLHDQLTKASWPHAFCPRPGGATLTAHDVERALRFFKRDAQGSLKPEGVTYSCEATALAPQTAPHAKGGH